MNRKEVVDFIKNDVLKGEELLYLCEFGSQLYGTDTPDSDTDYKGIFKPKLEDLVLQKAPKSFRYKTGNDDSRNTNEDTDIELWSLQYFLELVKKGETNSISLLFSPSFKKKIIYYDHNLIPMFDNPLRLFNPVDSKAFVGYAIGQAKKYGIKGSRLGIIKNVYEYLYEKVDSHKFVYGVLGDIKDEILNRFFDPSYCFEKEINGEPALVLCGKIHLFSIKITEFFNRVKREYEKYGKRAEEAERNEGIDWKALSHAMRSIFEMEHLLIHGYIRYPLIERSILKSIKKGEVDFKKVEEMIIGGLEYIEHLQKKTTIKGKTDQGFIDSIIINIYDQSINQRQKNGK